MMGPRVLTYLFLHHPGTTGPWEGLAAPVMGLGYI